MNETKACRRAVDVSAVLKVAKEMADCEAVIAGGPHPEDANDWPYYWFVEWAAALRKACGE